jgi:hypothetical protein
MLKRILRSTIESVKELRNFHNGCSNSGAYEYYDLLGCLPFLRNIPLPSSGYNKLRDTGGKLR